MLAYTNRRAGLQQKLEQAREDLINSTSVQAYDRMKLKIEYLKSLLQRYQ